MMRRDGRPAKQARKRARHARRAIAVLAIAAILALAWIIGSWAGHQIAHPDRTIDPNKPVQIGPATDITRRNP